MKTSVWRREVYDTLPLIETPEEWTALLEECRQTESDVADVHVRQLVLEGQDYSGLNFNRVWFENCRLAGLHLSRCGLREVWWQECDLSGGEIRRSHIRGCQFEKGKGVGLLFGDSFLRQTRFTGWNGRYAQWSSCELEQIDWVDSACRESLFSNCPWKDVRFSGTGLQQAQFVKTYLKGIDLTTCDLEGLSVSDRLTELQGAVVTFYQAAELAQLLGIVIR